jgi:hypothetical protein
LSEWQLLPSASQPDRLTQAEWITVMGADVPYQRERRGRTESELFKELLWHGHVLWGQMIYDTLQATDYLLSRPEIDPGRVGTLGMSMGSNMAWWHATLDERVAVCADLCCLTDYQALIQTRGLDGHGLYYYVPGLLKHFSTAYCGHQRADLPAAAPESGWYVRPAHAASGPGPDRYSASAGLCRSGVPEHWQLVRYATGHLETADMRRRVLDFLDRHLCRDEAPNAER